MLPFSLCVCNPPYLTKKRAIHVLDRNVLQNEPQTALVVDGDDPLVHYKTVLRTIYRPYRQACANSTTALSPDAPPLLKKAKVSSVAGKPRSPSHSVMKRNTAVFLFEVPPTEMDSFLNVLEQEGAQNIEIEIDTFGKRRCVRFQ